MNLNKVTLVGAGPGDPELMTLKGIKALSRADVILYDALANEEILDFASKSALKIYVGKRCGKRSLKQQDINSLLVNQVKMNKRVVRLKGGDPFIFGRGFEEVLHLTALGIEVDIIPGISSSTGLTALSGIPLTHRGTSESFWVLTGTTKDHKLSADIKLAVQSTATLVILMATRKLELIQNIFVSIGKESVPFMIIQNGSSPNERIITGITGELTQAFDKMIIGDPGILVFGEVVALNQSMALTSKQTEWIA